MNPNTQKEVLAIIAKKRAEAEQLLKEAYTLSKEYDLYYQHPNDPSEWDSSSTDWDSSSEWDSSDC